MDPSNKILIKNLLFIFDLDIDYIKRLQAPPPLLVLAFAFAFLMDRRGYVELDKKKTEIDRIKTLQWVAIAVGILVFVGLIPLWVMSGVDLSRESTSVECLAPTGATDSNPNCELSFNGCSACSCRNTTARFNALDAATTAIHQTLAMIANSLSSISSSLNLFILTTAGRFDSIDSVVNNINTSVNTLLTLHVPCDEPYFLNNLKNVSGKSKSVLAGDGSVNCSNAISCPGVAALERCGSVRVHRNSEIEPYIAVNPLNKLHIVATWQEDRIGGTGAAALSQGVAVTFDGGCTWTQVTASVPSSCHQGTSPSSTGPYGSSDPWVQFSSNGQIVYLQSLILFTTTRKIQVTRSLDGGLTWSAPVVIPGSDLPQTDKNSMTAHPRDPLKAYSVWHAQVPNTANERFSKTVDGGVTWSTAIILPNASPTAPRVGQQIIVMPNNTLLAFHTENAVNFVTSTNVIKRIAFRRSDDDGTTWTQPITAFELQPVDDPFLASTADPEGANGVRIRDSSNLFDITVNPVTGALYVVAERRSIIPGRRASVSVISMSTDFGATWSARIAMQDEDIQSYGATVAVEPTAQGNVAIS